MGHVLRKEGNDWVKKSMEMTVKGSRGRGRLKMTWEKMVERDMKVRGLMKNNAKDGVKMEGSVMGSKRLTPTSEKNGLKIFVCLFIVLLFCFVIIIIVYRYQKTNNQ